MKTIIKVFFASLVSCLCLQGISQMPSEGLVAFYPFNGNAKDASGNGNNGTIYGAKLTNDRCGYHDSAFYFDGSGANIQLPASQFLLNEYSYSLWIKIPAFPDESIDGWMMFSAGSTSSRFCQGIGIHPDGGICATSYNIGDNPIGSWAESPSIQENQWCHIVITRNYDKLQIYVNGELMPYVETDRYIPYTNNQDANYGYPDTRVIIGGRSNMTDPYPFLGYIDDFAIYNRVISAEEVKQLYAFTCKQSFNSLISYFPFSGNANDATGNGNNGVVHGPVLTTDRCGNPNSAYLFDGVDDFISLDTSYIMPESEGTFAAWVSFNSLNSIQYLGCLGDAFSQDYYLSFVRYDPAYQKLTIYRRTPENADIMAGSTVITSNQWYFVVMTSDGDNWSLYVNGVKENLSVVNGINTGDWGADVPQADNWLLGGIRIQEPHAHAYLNGKLDDIRVYDYPLNQEEIIALFNTYCPMELTGDQLVCPGEKDILYSVQLIEDLNYQWSYSGEGALLHANRNQVTIDFSENATSGTLSLLAERGGQVINNSTLEISILNLPAEAGQISGPTDACTNDGPYAFVVPEILNSEQYAWSFTGEDAELMMESNTLTIYFYNHATSGSLRVTGINQCGQGKISEPYPVIVNDCDIPSVSINIPNSFSPNGDNVNDLFIVRGLKEGTAVKIFDRNGKILYQTDNYNNDWNGIDMDGNIIQTGTYWYVIKVPGLNDDLKGFLYIKK